MTCPKCHSSRTTVYDTRDTNDGKEVRRRRRCLTCTHRWTTLEIREAAIKRVSPTTNSSNARM